MALSLASMLKDLMPVRSGLRPYQAEAVETVLEGFETHKSQLVVMATGLGKTQVFCDIANQWADGNVLILAHRDELIEQARKRYEAMFDAFVDIEKADWHSNHRSKVVVGSVPSFHKERREAMSKDRFRLIIIDECHHSLAKSYRDVLDYFSSAKILGVTATPDRADELALGKVFEHVAYVMDIEEGVEQGWLVPVHGTRVHLEEIQLEDVPTSQGDLAIGELDKAMVQAVNPIVRDTIRLSENKQAICFFPGCRSAEYAMQKFNAAKPGSCCYVDGETDRFTRRQIVDDFRAGRYQFMSNCQIATEGFDAPSTAVIVQARPTKSRALYAQMIGRGTRPLPGLVDNFETFAERRAAIAASAKPFMTVIDFVGNSGKHCLQTVEDVLGGNYSEAEIKVAKREQKEGESTLDALKAARRSLQLLAEKAKVRARTKVTAFDPFHVLGMEMPVDERFTNRFGVEPATDAQLAWFRDKGVPEKDLAGLSKRAAIKLHEQFKRRAQAGLASYKQMRQLQKFGVYDTDIPLERASAAMVYLAKKGWGRFGDVDGQVLAEIIRHGREMGE